MQIFLSLEAWRPSLLPVFRPKAAGVFVDATALDVRGPSEVAPSERTQDVRLYVRVPAPDAPNAHELLRRAMVLRPAGLLLLDTASGHDVTLTDARISVEEAELDIAHGTTRIIAAAGSTPASLFALESLIGSSARLEALIHDPAALARSVGAENPLELTRIARALTMAAAHAAGVIAIDGDDRFDAQTAQREGFAGKIVRVETVIEAQDVRAPK